MRSYSFTHAITRQPPASAIHGLRAVDTGAPDLAQMRAHHADYIAALKSTGAVVVELPALEAFPDSLFVEDTALCLPEGAVVMRPGAPTRLGEAALMAPHLHALYTDVRVISGADSFIEAGDILTTETEVLVGRSARTNGAGIAELAEKVAACGTIIPGARSIYNWKGSIEEAKEVVVIFKIPKANFSSFEKELREIHPYEVPEIVAFDPAAVCHAYAEWIVSSCAGGE